MNVKGKTILITGGAGGLGSAMARLLSENGARVLILDLEAAREKGEALAAELGTALAELQPIEGTADAVTEQARAAGRRLRDLAESATWNLAPLLALGGLLYLISASNSRR